jgi:hypothetical protein
VRPLVVQLLEDRNRLGGELEQFDRRALRIAEEMQVGELDLSPEPQALVVSGRGRLARFGQRRLAALEIAGSPLRHAELAEQLDAARIVGRKERGRATEQVDRCGGIRPLPSADAGRCKPLPGPRRQPAELRVARLELAAVPVRLLGVVAHELVRLVAPDEP